MKKLLSIILAVVMVLSSVTFVMADDDIKITINGEAKKFDVMPQIIEGRTLVPMRAIFEALGAEVGWDDAAKTASGKTATTEVSLTIDNKEAKVNGKAVTLDVPAQIIESRTMVPVRFIAESLGCEVEWDGDTKTVIITMEKKEEAVDPAIGEEKNLGSSLPQSGTVIATQEDFATCVKGKAITAKDGVVVIEAQKQENDNKQVAVSKVSLSGLIKEGNVYMLTFKARATSGDPYLKAYIQASKENGYKKVLFAATSYGKDWTTCYMPFVGNNYDITTWGFRVAGETHTTEIKDLQIIDYGTSVNIADLPHTYIIGNSYANGLKLK